LACNYYNVFISAADIALSDDARVYFNYYNCGTGLSATTDFYTVGTTNNAFCNEQTGGTPTYYILVGGNQTLPPNGSSSTFTSNPCGVTPTPTETPTQTPTPTKPSCLCEYYDVEITSQDISNATGNTGINEYRNGVVFVTYRPCSGGTQTILYTASTYYGNAFCKDNAYGITIDVWQDNSQISYTSQATPTGNCCGNITPTPTPTNTETPTQTPTNTQTPTHTPTQTPTNTHTPTQTPTNTQTPTLTRTPNSTPTNTPTTSVTPTNTLTPTTTPQPTQVYKLANDCDVFTLFPLGIECLTLSNVSSSNSVDGALSLKITGGTSPYTISWSNGQKTKTISGIGPGNYEAQVVDYYGDYTATTICSLFAPTPSPTPTLTTTPTPTSSGTYPNLCLSILTCPAIVPIQFTSGSIQNGKPSWSSVGGYFIVWNVTLQQWEIQNYTVFGGKLVSKTTSTPPLSGWFVQGGTSSPTVAMTLGTCPSYAPLNTTIQKTDSDCSNNGSIVIATCGGQTPYQYSIDGGSTFKTSNIFNNLAPQTYNVIVKDSLGNTSTSTTTISSTGGATSYTISVSNYNSTTINAGYIRSQWSVNVVPPIPQGTQISFKLNVNSTQVVNGPGSGTTSSLTNVYSGGTLITATSSDSNTSINTTPNCSPETTTLTDINDVYDVTIGYGYGISGVTFSTLNITSGVTSTNGCVTTLVQNISVFASSGLISGCNCCTINTDSLSYGGIENHLLSVGQGQTSQTYYSFIVGVGTTENGACSNYQTEQPTRLVNQSTFGVGVTIYTGSPSNPKPLLGFNNCVYNGNLYYMKSDTGQVTGPVLETGNTQKGC